MKRPHLLLPTSPRFCGSLSRPLTTGVAQFSVMNPADRAIVVATHPVRMPIFDFSMIPCN